MNAHDMTDKIRGIVERDGYVPVLETRYDETRYPFSTEQVGVIVVQDEETGKTYTVRITENEG